MAWLFGITLFVSALLLFLVQPMIAKMLLPLLGGAPTVWNTCMVFFQAMLLAGYAYAHLITTHFTCCRQLVAHFVLVLAAGLVLPFGVAETQVGALSGTSNPSLRVLWSLMTAVGLPFFVLSATSPLLQRWFSQTRHPSAADPYFLYSASNIGSLLALLGYPLILEPYLRLPQQSRLWGAGYAALALLLLACAVVMKHMRSRPVSLPRGAQAGALVESAAARDVKQRSAWKQRFHWVVLAFAPSSLMLGVTNYLTMDIASIPLLWAVPLGLYLGTFILSFSRRKLIPIRWMARAVPIGALALTLLILSRATHPVWLLILVHLAFFGMAGLMCHGQLAESRPEAGRLTEFYLLISVGGVLGGLFNALLAPNVFTSVVEYPVAIVLACLLRPSASPERPDKRQSLDFAFPVLLAMMTACLGMLSTSLGLQSVQMRNLLAVGLPAILSFVFVDRPLRFGLAVGAIFWAGWLTLGPYGKTLHAERNFFGVSRVTQSPAGLFRHLVHGNTLHGRQFVEPARQCEPLTYYHPSGPLGDVFELFHARPASTNVAVIGLGAGSMACYRRAGERWTFYEIDPAVIHIAQNTNYFTYLARCGHGEVRIVEGDARLRLREAPGAHYGLIVLDAFSSDAIPVHLLTREAVALYLSKLADGGLLAFHISNRYLDLEPVVAVLAQSANLVCRSCDDVNLSDKEQAIGKEESHWVVLARGPEVLGNLNRKSRWLGVQGRAHVRVWTDDFSNIPSVFKWK
jgi:hypothetical protein